MVHIIRCGTDSTRDEGVEEAYERKKTTYSDLVTEAAQTGWKVKIFLIEVGCRGFIATSTTRLLRKMGVRGLSLQHQSSQMQWKDTALAVDLKKGQQLGSKMKTGG